MGWVIGATLSILGSIASNLGVNIQKYSFIRQSRLEPQQRTTHWKDVHWLAGLGLVILGSLGDFAALSMVAQSIVAPLASVTLVTNVIFAHFWLHETVGRRELLGTLLIIVGSTLAVVFGDHEVRSYTNHDLVRLFGGGWFIFYAVLVSLLCIAGLMLHRRITPIKKNLVDAIRRYEVAVEANDAQAADWEDEVIARLEQEYKRWEKLHPFSLCALSGAFGAQSVLFGKCFAELLSTTFDGNNQMFHLFPYVALICMGVSVASQLHFLAIALNYFDALYAVPTFQCFFISVSTLGGALFFREVYSFSAGTACAFVIGLLMTLVGVAVLSTRRMSQREIVRKVGGEVGGEDEVALVPGGTLASTVIPEGDEDSDDLDAPRAHAVQQDALLVTRRGASSSSRTPSLTSSPALTSVSSDERLRLSGPQEYEMSSLHTRRSGLLAAAALPALKSTAQLNQFSDQVEGEQREFADLVATIDATSNDLAAKLALAGYGPDAAKNAAAADTSSHTAASVATITSPPSSSSSASLVESSLLHPSASLPMTPAMAIQIEADQAYINRAEDRMSANAHLTRKRSSIAAAKYDHDLLAAAAASLPEGASPRVGSRSHSLDFATTGVASLASLVLGGSGGSGNSSRPETPRSSYARMYERERAASFAGGSSGRTSPSPGSGANTPRRLGILAATDADSPAEYRTITAPTLSVTPSGGVVLPSAVFSGAFLDSAQELPDVENDTRLQRLTRLSTVGHWVAGLHGQMPFVGGVAQAILQAKEMKAALQLTEEAEKAAKGGSGAASSAGTAPPTPAQEPVKDTAETRIDMPPFVPILPQGIELMDLPPSSSSSSARVSPNLRPATHAAPMAHSPNLAPLGGNDTATRTPPATLTVDSTDLLLAHQPLAAAPATTSSSASAEPPHVAQPTKRVIEFNDDIDIFSTQAPATRTRLPTAAVPFESSDSTPLSPLSRLAASSSADVDPLIDSSLVPPSQALAALVEGAASKAAERSLFRPLSLTTHHPLQEGATPSPVAATASTLQGTHAFSDEDIMVAIDPLMPGDVPDDVLEDADAEDAMLAAEPVIQLDDDDAPNPNDEEDGEVPDQEEMNLM